MDEHVECSQKAVWVALICEILVAMYLYTSLHVCLYSTDSICVYKENHKHTNDSICTHIHSSPTQSPNTNPLGLG